MIKIPLQQIASQKFRIVLEGQNVTIRLFYRFGDMYADVFVGNETICLGSICRNRTAIVENAGEKFKGNLFFMDMLGDTDPQYEDLGSRYVFLYVSANESLPAGLVV